MNCASLRARGKDQVEMAFQLSYPPAWTISTVPNQFPAYSLPAFLYSEPGVLKSGNVAPLHKTLQWLCICLQNTSQTPEHDIRSPSQAGPQPSFPSSSSTFLHIPRCLGDEGRCWRRGEEGPIGTSSVQALQTSNISWRFLNTHCSYCLKHPFLLVPQNSNNTVCEELPCGVSLIPDP